MSTARFHFSCKGSSAPENARRNFRQRDEFPGQPSSRLPAFS